MDRIYVHGRIPLRGQLTVQGSKNAALPILAATLLTEETCVIHNCPKILDALYMQKLLKRLGYNQRWEMGGLRVSGCKIKDGNLLFEEVGQMRCSIFFLGALLGAIGRAELSYPGGCVIGKRPIDIHIDALKKLNVQIECKDDKVVAWTDGLIGEEIVLPFPSVGATENLLLAAVKAKGATRIRGAAREPEIVALGQFLNSMGAKIKGLGSPYIEIEGVKTLGGTEFTIPSDRIVAGTYLYACMCTGGTILLNHVPVKDMTSIFETIESMGGNLQMEKTQVFLQAPMELKPIEYMKTQVHPGFPTDLQSPLLATLCMAKGESMIQEDIFENRFQVVPELQKMGAEIEIIEPNLVKIKGGKMLYGNMLEAKELRGGAALVVAALGAKGHSGIGGKTYIDRGYVNICKDLRDLGARIYSV